MEKYKNIIFVILTSLLFLTLFIQDRFWEKKYELQQNKINTLTKVVDSLNNKL